MVNVAKTTRRLYPHQLDPKLRGIIDRMGTQASNQTRVAIDAFADADPSWAAALADMDDAMDELTKSLFRHILAATAATRARCCSRCRWRWSAGTTSASPTTRSRSRNGCGFMVTGEHPSPEADADASN